MHSGVPNKEFNKNLFNILNQLESDSNLLNNHNYIRDITFLLGAGADRNTQNQDGKTLSYYLDEKLLNILNKLAINRNLLFDPDYIQCIMFLLGAGANPNIPNQDGETLSYYLDKKLSDILNELAMDRNLLFDPDHIQRIMFLLQAGADPKIQGEDGKTLSHYLDEKLSNILNELAMKRDELDNPDRIQYIMFLLQAGANRDTKNRHGKTLSHYLDERLSDILGWLASDRGILNDYIQHIMFLLQAGANPNVQNQGGKTLLHYVAERNDTNGIEFLLQKGADPNVRDLSGRTPFEQVKSVKLSDCNTEEDSDYHSDDSYENEENPANNSSNYPNKHNDDQALRDDPGYGSGDDNKIISTKPSDCDRKDEDSSCSSSDYLFLEDSLLAKLEIPLTTDEQELINKFCEEIIGITTQNKQESEESILESIEEIVEERLKEGPRLNSCCSCCKKTVTNSILEEIDNVLSSNHLRLRDETGARERQSDGIADQDDDNEDKVSGIIKRITSSLVSKGGVEKGLLFYNELGKHYDHYYLDDLNKQYKDRKEELISTAYESIVNKSKQPHEYDFKAGIDNQYFYVKYPQDSIIEPAKILNHEKAKELNLKVGTIQIGKSIVKVKSVGKKRNYTDILKGSIEMSFTTEVGEISICLQKDGNKIKVEIDEENKAKFNKLKDKSSLGENCLLEGENVSEVIGKNFESVPTETTKNVPSTDLTQVCLQRKARSRS